MAAADLAARLDALLKEVSALSPEDRWVLVVPATTFAAAVGALAAQVPHPVRPESAREDAGLRHFTPRQVAALLHDSEGHVRELCRTGLLPAAKLGKSWRVSEAAIRAWAASGRVNGLDTGLNTPYSSSRDGDVRDGGAVGTRRVAGLRVSGPLPPADGRDRR